MSLPSFIDKLAPELRVAIYGHVLGSSQAIKPKNSTASLGIDNKVLALSAQEELKHSAVEASILATNKLIYKEAVQVLYHNRTFRATFPELERLLQHKDFVANVEFIEVADCVNAAGRCDPGICSRILKRLQQLPRIRSIVMLSDCLNGLALHDAGPWTDYTYTQSIAVPDFIQNWLGLRSTTCVDIGRYQLHGEYSGVQVVNRRLTTMWPSAQSVPTGYDAWADLECLTQKWKVLADIPNQMTLTLQTSFRCWVGLHEELASLEASGELDELFEQDVTGSVSDLDMAKLRIAKEWAATTLNSRLTDMAFLPNMYEPRTLNLRHLKPGDDPNMLCWATEYLAANISVSRCNPYTGPTYTYDDALARHWVEIDGGMHTIERRIEEQKLAFAGLPNPSYVLEPVRKASLLDLELVKQAIRGTRLGRLATQNHVGALDPLEIVQLARVVVATTQNHWLGLPNDANYRQELDDWSCEYLKRHLRVSEWADPDMIREISLEDTRRSLQMLLLGDLDLKEVRTDPPEGLDADLFVPLAWKFGWKFANICAEQHEASHEFESSSDWEEGGSEEASGSEGED